MNIWITIFRGFNFYFLFVDTSPKELATGLEKREIINDEQGKDPVSKILGKLFSYFNKIKYVDIDNLFSGFRTHMA